MNQGYVKLWRKSLDAGWIRNHKLWAFWTWCLLSASHKEYEQIVGYQRVHLMPGDFIFGRKAASEELNMSEQEIRTIISFLKKVGNITIKSTNKYSIISIINWGIYQGQETIINQQINQQLTNKQPATNQQLTTNKNDKNIKKEIYKERKVKKQKTTIPENFTISDRVKEWAVKKNMNHLEHHLESFKLACAARGYEYIDWDAAFMRAVTDNWAKIKPGIISDIDADAMERTSTTAR
jgi:hypothetical protein